MDADLRVISSIESLEAQLELAREYTRLQQWDSLDLVVQSINRASSCLAEVVQIAKAERPAARSKAAGVSNS